jgi:hypothetical protein
MTPTGIVAEKGRVGSGRHSGTVALRRAGLGVVAALVAPVAVVVAAAQDDAQDALVFDIPAQPLESAIHAFVGASGSQVLYETALTKGRHAQAVRGEFGANTALGILLRGTGLRALYTAGDAFTLVPVPDPPAASAPPSPEDRSGPGLDLARHGLFLGIAQAESLAALCRHPLTHPGAYRMTLRLRIAPGGTITDVEVAEPASKAAVTETVALILRGVRFSIPPPADLPQPLIMTIAPPRVGGTPDCAPVTPSTSMDGAP